MTILPVARTTRRKIRVGGIDSRAKGSRRTEASYYAVPVIRAQLEKKRDGKMAFSLFSADAGSLALYRLGAAR